MASIPPVSKGVSVLGIISLVLGIVGLPFALLPCVNVLSLPFVGVGLLLGIIGFFVARSGETTGTGLPIAGTAVNLVGLLISLAWFGAMAYFVKDAQAQLAQEEKAIREGPAVTTSAKSLFEQYQTNSLGADTKFKDQVVEVSGIVDRIRTDDVLENKVTVELKTTEDGETIDCNFAPSHKSELGKLSIGKAVTIRGKCKGRFLGSVTLEKCVLKR